MVSVGTIVWLSSELMFFAALFAMYFTMRAVNQATWSEYTEKLNVPFATVNTIILVLSSVTCQLGVFAAERGDLRRLRIWYVITFVIETKFGAELFPRSELCRKFLECFARDLRFAATLPDIDDRATEQQHDEQKPESTTSLHLLNSNSFRAGLVPDQAGGRPPLNNLSNKGLARSRTHAVANKSTAAAMYTIARLRRLRRIG